MAVDIVELNRKLNCNYDTIIEKVFDSVRLIIAIPKQKIVKTIVQNRKHDII